MRQRIHKACITGFVICIIASYPLAQIAAGNGSISTEHIGLLTSFQFFCSALFMLGAWLSTNPNQHWSSYSWLLIIGVVLRLALIPVDSYTSNDIDRYLWDGSVALQGFDPYIMSPDNPLLSNLRETWPTPPEHAAYATIYPPLAIAGFALVSSVGPVYAPLLWKLLLALVGITTLVLSVSILRHARRLQHFALIALSPLLILETGIGSHLDALTTLTITVALYAWQRRRYTIVGIFIGLGTLLKLLPIFLLAPVFFGLHQKNNKFHLLLGTALTLILGYGLAIVIGLQPMGALSVFLEKWRFGSPLFNSLNMLLTGTYLSIAIATFTIATLACSSVIAKRSPIAAFQLAIAAPLLFSPVVFPWYLTALVPLVAITPSAFILAWLTLLPLTYEVLGRFLAFGEWAPAMWPLWALAAGCTIALLIDILLFRKRLCLHN